jgi:pSer/pThr/pTyr-binding forkhead associated (FHA) protein
LGFYTKEEVMQSTYRLVMRSGPSVGKVYPLDRAEAFVGRDLNNDIVINDPEISRRHSRLYAQGNGFVLEDLGSTNGTFVNGQRLLGPYVLRPGDTITFGERLNMVFESAEVDQDATMVSPSARAYPASAEPENISPARSNVPPSQEPVYQAQEPVYPAPVAMQQQAPSYSGQVPGSYPPGPDIAAAPVRRTSTTLIIAIIILVLMCLCVAGFLFFAPKDFWCIFPIWPAGACP